MLKSTFESGKKQRRQRPQCKIFFFQRRFYRNKSNGRSARKTNQGFSEKSFYLLHHSVLNDSNPVTKLRVFFDASAKISTKTSLLEFLMVAPKIRSDLIAILLRFQICPLVLRCINELS